jgi:hypothetical protein
MECPHCHSEYTAKPHYFALGEDQDGTWQISSARCDVCDRLIVNVCQKDGATYPGWPQPLSRPDLPAEVPAEYADDYHAACRVKVYSAEAAAALGRRALHRLLSAEAKAGDDGLLDQIRRVVLGSEMPQYLKQGLQTFIRVARLDLHPGKSQSPDALTAVEPGEVEWLLDLLESLFELYFIQPARLSRKQTRLEEILAPPAPPAPPDPPAASEPAQPSADTGATTAAAS